MRGERGTGSDLPAPYRNPWALLAEDLRAVGSSILLKLRELGRRNRQGDLARPAFWPRSLAALFWPALLTALLVGVVLLGRLLVRPPPAVPPPPPPATPAPAAPAAPAPAAPAPVTVAPAPDSPSPETLAPGPGAEIPSPAPAEEPSPAASPPPPPPAPSPPDPDPLLLSLGEGGSDPLLLSATARPARSELVLDLGRSFAALSAPARQERAEGWWRRSRELGFEHLELRDGDGRLLGRSALVGSGMILLEPTPPG